MNSFFVMFSLNNSKKKPAALKKDLDKQPVKSFFEQVYV